VANKEINTGGISVTGLLGVAFVVLKLTGVIDWSWGWVLAPFWIPLVIFLTIFAMAIVGFVVFALGKAYMQQRRDKRRYGR